MCKYCCTYVELPNVISSFFYLTDYKWFISQTNAWELLSHGIFLELLYKQNIPLLDEDKIYEIKKQVYEEYFSKVEENITNNFDNEKYDYTKIFGISILKYNSL